MTYEALTLDIEGGVATITLNRPEAANSLNQAMALDLMNASIECSKNQEIRAAVLTGSGSFFCAGGDLKSFQAVGVENISSHILQTTTYLHAAISRFARMDAPLIGAINGIAAGAGASLTLMCDLAIGADSMLFIMAYTAAGLVPDGSSTYFLPRVVGLRRAAELMITNRRLSAEECLEWGIVNKVVAADQVLAEAQGLAKQLAEGSTGAYGGVKKMLAVSFDNGLETQMEVESQQIASAAASADGQEGINAFIAKRKPNFPSR